MRVDATRLFLDICDAFAKAFCTALGKPYVAVKVQLVPQIDKSAQEAKDLFAFTIINESGPDIEVQEMWFLTSYNRRIFSKSVDSKMPIRVRSKDRATYFMPFEELSSAVNKTSKETITEAVIFDKTEHQYTGRVDTTLEQRLAN